MGLYHVDHGRLNLTQENSSDANAKEPLLRGSQLQFANAILAARSLFWPLRALNVFC